VRSAVQVGPGPPGVPWLAAFAGVRQALLFGHREVVRGARYGHGGAIFRASCVTGIGKSRVLPFFVVSSVCRQDAHLAWVCGPFRQERPFDGSRWNRLRRSRPHFPSLLARAGVPASAGVPVKSQTSWGSLWWWLAGDEESKGIWWMPWRQEAMKDVARCEKLGGAASRR
jgi:hypothetical protein